MVFARPHLLVFGGNTGNETVNDVWCLDLEHKPLSWARLDLAGPSPMPRVYHSAALCSSGTAAGMMVVFGGRGNDQAPLSDTWGLRRHRNGKWDWVLAPEKAGNPVGRFQHHTAFMGQLMVVVGGRTNNVNDLVPLDVYDTETSQWTQLPAVRRFRHYCWTKDSSIYILGGFAHDKPSVPTSDLTRLDTVTYFAAAGPSIVQKLEAHLSRPIPKEEPVEETKISGSRPVHGNQENELSLAQRRPVPSSSPNFTPVLSRHSSSNISPNSSVEFTKVSSHKLFENSKPSPLKSSASVHQASKVPTFTLQRPTLGKAIAGLCPSDKEQEECVADEFIDYLLRPSEWSARVDGNGKFPFDKEKVVRLAAKCIEVLSGQPMVLRLKVPIKVFGDIHGQYQDLMRFFHLWGAPAENKANSDIECFDYLFLGDYVDRGSHSLETICLLMALKVKYPLQVHLLRGNHEDRWINNAFGFGDECAGRLGEDMGDPDSVFSKINEVFDWLPLAATIEDRVLCLHGGIGSQLNAVEQIETLARPLEIVHEVATLEHQLVIDILWSDPTDTDNDLGIQANTIRDPNGTGNIVKFGPDKVHEFLQNNKLSLILRAHECVMDGFERFAGGELITVFSATDYCGRHKNAGAMLLFKRNNEIVPNLIYPLADADSDQNWNTEDEPMKCRPPTPPRWVGNARENSFN